MENNDFSSWLDDAVTEYETDLEQESIFGTPFDDLSYSWSKPKAPKPPSTVSWGKTISRPSARNPWGMPVVPKPGEDRGSIYRHLIQGKPTFNPSRIGDTFMKVFHRKK